MPDGRLTVRLFGPAALERDGVTVALGPKERTVLAVLAAASPHPCSEERLVAALWGGDPPRTARRTLQAYVSRLRGELATGEGVRLVGGPAGLRLEADPACLDLQVAHAALASARDLRAAGRPGEAHQALVAVEATWRGASLGDLAAGRWAGPVVADLDELRTAVVEQRVAAGLDAGGHAALVDELAALTSSNPLHEPFWALRALALYRCGRQAEALRALGALRRVLLEELGTPPGPEVVALEAAVLSQDPALDLPGAPSSEPAPTADTPPALPLTSVAGAVGLPARFRVERLAPYVDHSGALPAALAAWQQACEEGPQLVLVEGDAGIGKSRLAAEVAAVAHAAGALVLAGGNDEELSTPYQPFIEALRHLVDGLPAASAAELLGDGAGEMVRLLPDVAPLVAEPCLPTASEPETLRFRLLEALVRVVESVGSHRPTLLVVEDVHWAAQSTVLALGHLTAHLHRGRVLLLVTCRDAELFANEAAAGWRAGLHRTAAPTRIHLGAFDLAATEALLEGAAGHPLEPDGHDLARRLHDTTEGNPFFIEETLRHLAGAGSIARAEDGRWAMTVPMATLGLPEGVRDLLRRRIAALPVTTRTVLRTAAVIGRRCDPAVLEGCHPDVDVAGALQPAIDAGVVVEVEVRRRELAWEFSHALFPASVTSDLSHLATARLHARVAGVLDEGLRLVAGAPRRDARLQLARHRLAAVAVDGPDPAMSACLAAAGDALEALAFDLAAELSAEALALHGMEQSGAAGPFLGTATPTAVRLLVTLAEARFRAGSGDHRPPLEAAWREAARLGIPELCSEAALACSRGYWSGFGEVDVDRVAALETAIGCAATAEGPVLARLLAELAAELAWDAKEADRFLGLSDRALAMARRVGDDATLAAVVLLRLGTLWAPSTLGERAALADEARVLATRLQDPVRAVQAATHQLFCDVERGRAERLGELREFLDRAAPTLGQASWEYSVHYATMNYLTIRGTPADICEVARHAEAIGNRLQLVEAPYLALCEIAGAHGWADTYHEVVGVVEDVADTFESLPAMRAWCASIFARTGRTAAAVALLDAFSAEGCDFPVDHSQAVAWSHLAIAAFEVGHRRSAAAVRDRLEPLRGTVVRNPLDAAGPAELYLARCAWVLDDVAATDRDFARALEVAEAMGGGMWAAHIHLDWGRTLQGRDPVAAGAHAAEALRLAGELGLDGVVAKAAVILEAA